MPPPVTSQVRVVSSRSAPNEASLSLFPTERDPGVSFSQEEILLLSRRYAPLYTEISGRVAAGLEASCGLPAPAAAVLARKASVPLVHCFFDRLLRLSCLVARHPDAELRVANGPDFPPPSLIETFQSLAWSSEAFNDAVLRRAAPAWRLEPAAAAASVRTSGAEPAVPFVNHNFTPGSLFGKLRKRLARAMRAGRLPALSMAYDTDPLQENGLYGRGRLIDLYHPPAPPPPLRDEKLRAAVLDAALDRSSGSLRRFLTESGVAEPAVQDRALAAFSDFFRDFYPSGLLESAKAGQHDALERLRPYAGRWLFIEGAGDHFSIHMVAAAKSLGMKIAGCQHGGIYGHLLDIASVNELEYPFYDRFVTWGWTRLPEHEAFRGLETVPLPNPWLSERRRSWRGRRDADARSKPYDALLMTNKIYPFTPAPAGADVSRADRLPEFAAMLKVLAAAARRRGMRVLHKPFNDASVGLLRDTYRELDAAGESFQRVKTLDKGLTPELIDRCRVVLWDQPASGFLECLASGIPTMVYWPRFYNRETAWAEPFFARLESVGLVHRDVDSLFAGLDRFRAAPQAWAAEPDRAAAVAEFLAEYGRASDDWPARWKTFIEGQA